MVAKRDSEPGNGAGPPDARRMPIRRRASGPIRLMRRRANAPPTSPARRPTRSRSIRSRAVVGGFAIGALLGVPAAAHPARGRPARHDRSQDHRRGARCRPARLRRRQGADRRAAQQGGGEGRRGGRRGGRRQGLGRSREPLPLAAATHLGSLAHEQTAFRVRRPGQGPARPRLRPRRRSTWSASIPIMRARSTPGAARPSAPSTTPR